jgi:hypothetical protein
MPTITPEECENALFRWGQEYSRAVATDSKERCSSWYRRIKPSHDDDQPMARVYRWTHRVRKAYDNASVLPRSHDNRASILRLKAERLRPEFVRLSDQWQSETKHLSLVSQKVAHPSYFRIIGMGEAVLPLLLEALRDRPSHWFVALQATANTNPVSDGSNPSIAREAWLSWGRSQKLID